MEKDRATLCTLHGEIEVDATAFRPDWTLVGTKADIERELDPFEWNGIGWYITKGIRPFDGKEYNDTLLILPMLRSYPSKGIECVEPNTQTYLVCVWNHHEVGNAFNWIVTAPVRVDQR